MTKADYTKIIAQRIVIENKERTDFGTVTKFNDEFFSVLWNGETHSGNYTFSELKELKDADGNKTGAFYVEEKRVNKPEEKS